MVLYANISFTFQAVKNLFSHSTCLCFKLFCKFWGDFWVYLGINSFLKGLVKFMEMGDLEDLMLSLGGVARATVMF